VSAEDIKIALDASGVAISALRRFPCRDDASRVHRIEIPFGRFERRLGLPLDALELSGKSLADGVLTLTFRKKE
jgi:HSP20 family protein